MNPTNEDVLASIEAAVLPTLKMTYAAYFKANLAWDTPPENLLQVATCQAFAKSGFRPALEVWLTDVVGRTSVTKQGRPRGSDDGRFDVALLDDSGQKPLVLIECKRAWSYKDVVDDARRLEQMLAKQGLEACFLVVYSDDSRNKPADTMKEIDEKVAWQVGNAVVLRPRGADEFKTCMLAVYEVRLDERSSSGCS
jgi:hypothetical protein